MTPEQLKQELVEEFARYYGHSELVSVEDTKHENGIDYFAAALDHMAQVAREEERKVERARVRGWVREHRTDGANLFCDAVDSEFLLSYLSPNKK